MSIERKPRLGISACLVGEPVRFDGGHKKNTFIVEHCARHFGLLAVCPEAELGLGIPRPAIQLRQINDSIQLVHSKNPGIDLTEKMRSFSSERIKDFSTLDGFVFKKNSPSCGMERVPVVDNKTGQRVRNGTGVFAGTLKQSLPNLPTEEEGRLNNIKIRENFFERVYAHYRWRQVASSENVLSALREYHRRYKFILMAKSNIAYRELGKLVAGVNIRNINRSADEYFEQFMQVMARIPEHGHHINVMMHIMGYLKKRLVSGDKAELLEIFELYRRQQINRVTPMVLLQHHFRHYPDRYIAEQYYFSPFPANLMRPV